MSAWKYVMFRDKYGRRFPVIFPAEVVHSEMAEAVTDAVRSGEVRARAKDYSCPKPVSAGFIGYLSALKVGGESETLSLKSGEEDAHLINVYHLTRGVAS